MMEKLVKMTEGTNTKIMVSLENHMACGVGACLVCTCKTKSGNKKHAKMGQCSGERT
ncbi:iron-sulfur cluster binding domain of dihydroorotate dehydrogenase B family protein [[Clostridium] sordellii ATCC 9714]|nr:iron-sulfur cluster binding domain of dihydroorotate dehydrogenase B family protein [[Clostridium] sordellii ATCC 9714] [Paeniclostridium sordellii ATCC 9714]